MQRRRNTDEELRGLERAAADGAPDAVARLITARLRAAVVGATTLDQLAALTDDGTLAHALAAMPERLTEAMRTVLAEVVSPPLPAMTHEEIVQLFRDTNYGRSLTDYEEAIQVEAEALDAYDRRGSRRRPSATRFLPQARAAYADNVSDFLARPQVGLEPHEIFGNRIRPAAWATARRIREIMAEQAAAPAPDVSELRVHAEAHSDDQEVSIPFDATIWFDQASDGEIVDLAAEDWRGEMADLVARLFEHTATAGLFRHTRRTGSSFECSVDGDEALAWIAVNRQQILSSCQPD